VKNYKMFAISLLTVAMLIVAGCGGGAPQATQVDWTFTVEGEVSNPLTLSYADLAEMQQVQLEQVLMQKSRGEDTTNDWEGVPLTAIFEQADVSAQASGITALAADGYAIMIPMADLEDAIVALKMDGEWIATSDPDHGPIRLVVPNKPSNHWVFQLQTIVVEGAGALPPSVEWELAIEGAVDNERTFNYSQLSGLEAELLEGVVMQTKKGDSTHSFEGARVTTLFDLVGASGNAEGMTATAADGYSVSLSMTELGEDAIVALKMDGEWLAGSDPENPVRLVVPGLPASKWVSQLVRITVE